ncbi:MAG TPA: helix-turn-helix domain-containing protein [Candidatus Limnocylindrales bacterium]
MNSYRQYCPIARGAEIFAERWTPLIIRNLYMGCRTFTEILEGAPGMSKTLLTERLRAMERYEVVERRQRTSGRGHTYHLTQAGTELVDVCFALGNWGARWLEIAPEHLGPHVVLWSMSRLADLSTLPQPHVVVRFDLTDQKRQNRYWMLLETTHAEVCMTYPGHPEDLIVTTTSEWLAKWHMGWISLRAAQNRKVIDVAGPPRLVRVLATLGRSKFADVRPARQSADTAIR